MSATRRDITLQFIIANPGCTFGELHTATQSGVEKVMASTTRATDRLVREGLIRKERDGRCVRHFPA